MKRFYSEAAGGDVCMGREVYWDERQRSEKMKLNLGIFMNPVQKIPIRLGSGGAFSAGGWGIITYALNTQEEL